MCDYSLHLTASRPAKVGDKLVSTSFPETITRGFASGEDLSVAVCLLPGTELAFDEEVRCETGMVSWWKLGHRVATFVEVNKDRLGVHHDALEFPDGKVVLLTQLSEGQHATVLQLPLYPESRVRSQGQDAVYRLHCLTPKLRQGLPRSFLPGCSADA